MIGTIAFLILIALVLMALEVYIPGFIVGSIGVVLMVVAAVLCYGEYGPGATMGLIGLEVVLGLAVVIASLKYFPNTRMGRRMVLNADQMDQRAAAPAPPELVGQEGVAHTVLRPAGVAVVGGKRLDVLAESGMIAAHSAIRVVAVEGNRIVVRAV